MNVDERRCNSRYFAIFAILASAIEFFGGRETALPCPLRNVIARDEAIAKTKIVNNSRPQKPGFCVDFSELHAKLVETRFLATYRWAIETAVCIFSDKIAWECKTLTL